MGSCVQEQHTVMGSCVQDHELQLVLFDDSERSCDVCGAPPCDIKKRFHCTMGCDYEFCEMCTNKGSNDLVGALTTLRCPDGHSLVITFSEDRWSCSARRDPNGCESGTGRFASVSSQLHFTCSRGCDYDICGPCYDTKIKKWGLKSAPQPLGTSHVLINSAGILSYPSYDFRHSKQVRHYCGRFVGQRGYASACVDCDGRCSPDTGCQCTSCFNLDAEDTQTSPSTTLDTTIASKLENSVRCSFGHTLYLVRGDHKEVTCAGRAEVGGCRGALAQPRGNSCRGASRGGQPGQRSRRRRGRGENCMQTKGSVLSERSAGPVWMCSGGCPFAYCARCYDAHQKTIWMQNDLCAGMDGAHVSSNEKRIREWHHVSSAPGREIHARDALFPECAVCFENRPLATLIHGSSGHTICCRNCSVNLVNQKHPCPICRQKIEAVIDVFV